jgi:hypothetical protein
MTWPLVVAAAIGLGFAFTTALRGPTSLIVVLGAVVPYVLVASSGHRAMRFLAPMLPAVALLAARGISAIFPSRGAASLVPGAVFARAALASVLVIRLFFKDSRQEAQRWLESHVPAGATVDLMEHPDQQPERARFFGDLLAGRGAFEVAARFRQQGFWRPEVEFVDPEIVVLRKRP